MTMGEDTPMIEKKDEGKYQPNGLPDMGEAGEGSGTAKGVLYTCFAAVVFTAIGTGLALAIYLPSSTRASYDKNIDQLTGMFSNLPYAYLSLLLLSKITTFVNMFPMFAWKGKVMGKHGNLRANMKIYKVIGDGAPSNTSVVMHTDGAVGSYNRANRSMEQFLESSIGFFALVFPLSLVFGLPVFLLTMLFCLGRALHQTGYAAGGYGKHGLGFGLATLAMTITDGLTVIVAARGFGLI